MSSNPFSAAIRGVKKKIDPGRYDDGHTKRTSTNEPLTHLPVKTLSKLTPEELRNYPNDQLERLELDRLQVLPGETLSRLNPDVLARLPSKTISRLTPEALVQLPAAVLAELSNHFLSAAPPEVLFRALPALDSDDLRKLKKAIHRIGHERLRQLPPDVIRRLPIPDIDVPAPESPQLPIQKHDISIHRLDKGLPAIPQSTHDFGMSTEYLDSRYEQQSGVMSFSAHYNTANIDPSAFPSSADRSYASPPSPTHTYTGRSSPAAVKSLATVHTTTYPPKTSDHRPPHAPRRNSSVSRGSHTRARSSSRGPKPDREREYQAYTSACPRPVTVAEYGPTKVSELPRDVSELGFPTAPPRLSSHIDDLSPSEIIRRAETWKEEHREIPRKETPRESREIIPKEDPRSMSPTSTSTSSSPEVASFAERERAAQGHMISSANDDAGSNYKDRVIKDHTISELKMERDNLNNQLINAKAKNIALLDRLDKYLERKSPSKKHTGDAIDVVIAYCEELCDGHSKIAKANKDWEDTWLREKKHRQEVEDQLEEKSRRLRVAEDNLLGLQSKVNEYSQRATELETQESSLRNDLGRLERENKELHKRCENQKAHSDAVIKKIQHEHESNVAQLRQTAADHDSQMRSQQDHHESEVRAQKEYYAQEMQKQRVYYEGQVNSLHQQLADQSQSHQTQLAQATKDLQDTITNLHSQHQQELNRMETAFNENVAALQTTHNQQIAAQQKKHEQDIQRLNKKHARNVVDLREKVQSLENDLVGNNDDFRPATDDSLKIQYRQLKLCIDMVTEPINLGISGVPRNLGKLDPTRFLEREGKNQLRFLLRSVVWQKIVEGFFSEPFGFGALGRGEGREVLRGVVEGWRGLCGYDDGSLSNGKTASRSTTTDTDLLTPFFHSREANKWRSATFQSILMAVAPPSSSMSGNKSNSRKGQQQAPSPSSTPGPPEHPIATPYYANINQVQSQIVALLSSICSETLSPEIQSKVSELARQAGELALQFGAQRAQLGLEVPKRGEQVKIGTESGWVDCEDGDSFGGRRGVEVEVDLCVSPKVYRVGDMDGRNMGDRKGAKVKAIVAGEVYPRRS
ncbi:hypothetical protein B0H65DRAFT_212984 [Neurospora tetraspora]|uniref:Uncharacterized protein n=1 Tax=Neurospora tetraspora TaxID=94610 RepID=A0AAE0JG91_9PEZI|nr:hypothetical protein B0H65DRAFT_212984 [Neurospora tetraspora]